MDWDKLRIFHVVAEAGSFTHAGENLQLSQSAISRHISTLEESLGVTLFHRHARGLILTEQGELLHKTSRDIFTKLSMIEAHLTDSKDRAEGTLFITAAEFIGSLLIAPNLHLFQSQYPHIQITLLLDDKVLNLGMREADAAIRLYKPNHPDLIQKNIAEIELALCASKNYLLKNGTPQNLTQLKEHQIIAYPENAIFPYDNPNSVWIEADIDLVKNPKVLRINSLQAILKATQAGSGLSVLPKFIIQKNNNLEIVNLSIKPPSVNMYFVYPEERRHSKRISLFKDFVIKLLETTNP